MAINYKGQIFFILPFEMSDVEVIWDQVYEPVSKELGFEPVRSDRRDRGPLVLDQIKADIAYARIVVADLTYERPNCYYEVGLAHGSKKDDLVILCTREDHLKSFDPQKMSIIEKIMLIFSNAKTMKIHFDLSGYNILRWKRADIEKFKKDFKNRLAERISQIEVASQVQETVRAKPSAGKINGATLDNIAQDNFRKLEQK